MVGFAALTTTLRESTLRVAENEPDPFLPKMNLTPFFLRVTGYFNLTQFLTPAGQDPPYVGRVLARLTSYGASIIQYQIRHTDYQALDNVLEVF